MQEAGQLSVVREEDQPQPQQQQQQEQPQQREEKEEEEEVVVEENGQRMSASAARRAKRKNRWEQVRFSVLCADSLQPNCAPNVCVCVCCRVVQNRI
jgi:hypothetical protein